MATAVVGTIIRAVFPRAEAQRVWLRLSGMLGSFWNRKQKTVVGLGAFALALPTRLAASAANGHSNGNRTSAFSYYAPPSN